MNDLLLFTRTVDDYRHVEAIEAGVPAIVRLAREAGLSILHTEDRSDLSDEALARARAVIFHQVNGEVLDEAAASSVLNAVEQGCGFAGIHAASCALRGWPDYLKLVGARFESHPPMNEVPRDLVVEADDPSVRALPRPWAWSDEWYEFEAEPVGVEPVLTLADERHRALSWRGQHGRGRTWYTALGHRGEAYSDPVFLGHVWGGIASVLR